MSPKLSDVERSVVLWSMFAIRSTLTCSFSENMSLLQMSSMSLHVTQFYQPPLVLQVTNAGVRGLGTRLGIWSLRSTFIAMNICMTCYKTHKCSNHEVCIKASHGIGWWLTAFWQTCLLTWREFLDGFPMGGLTMDLSQWSVYYNILGACRACWGWAWVVFVDQITD